MPPFWGIFSLMYQKESVSRQIKDLHFAAFLSWFRLPVVIADSSGEASGTDPVAHDVDPLTEPELHPDDRYGA